MSIYLPQSLPLHPQSPPKADKFFFFLNETKENTRDEEWCMEFHCSSSDTAALWWVCIFAPKAKRRQRPFAGIDAGRDRGGSWFWRLWIRRDGDRGRRAAGQTSVLRKQKASPDESRSRAESHDPSASQRWRRFVRVLCSHFLLEPCDPP